MLAECCPNKHQGCKKDACHPKVHCVNSLKHSTLPRQPSDRTRKQASIPPFFCQFFLRRLTAGRNQIIERRFTVVCPELAIARRFLNGGKHRRIKSKCAIRGRCSLQLVLAAFQQSASLFAMQQDQRCPLRMISLWLNTFDTPIIRQRNIAAALYTLKFARETRTAGV